MRINKKIVFKSSSSSKNEYKTCQILFKYLFFIPQGIDQLLQRDYIYICTPGGSGVPCWRWWNGVGGDGGKTVGVGGLVRWASLACCWCGLLLVLMKL